MANENRRGGAPRNSLVLETTCQLDSSGFGKGRTASVLKTVQVKVKTFNRHRAHYGSMSYSVDSMQ